MSSSALGAGNPSICYGEERWRSHAGRPLVSTLQDEGSYRHRLTAAALGTRAAAIAFNTLTHPRVYGLTSRLPGLGLGTTRFHALESVNTLPVAMWGQVGAAYSDYSEEEWQLLWLAVLPMWERLGLRPLECAGVTPPRTPGDCVWRCSRRDAAKEIAIVSTLNRHGLGASVMYDAALNRIREFRRRSRRCRCSKR